MSMMSQHEQFKHWRKNDVGNTDVIISSHGGRSLMGGRGLTTGLAKKKVPPGTTLVFYGPDRAVLEAASLKYEFLDHNLAGQSYKEKGPNAPYVDYELTKLQGYHGNEDETYDTVETCLPRYDVVTIRYRGLSGGSIMLSDLLKRLAARGYVYKRVHCLFCRCLDNAMLDLINGRSSFVTPT